MAETLVWLPPGLSFSKTPYDVNRPIPLSPACCTTRAASRSAGRPTTFLPAPPSLRRMGLSDATFARARQVFRANSYLRLLQHPDDLLLAEPALLHGAFPLVVVCPENLSFSWNKFRRVGLRANEILLNQSIESGTAVVQ